MKQSVFEHKTSYSTSFIKATDIGSLEEIERVIKSNNERITQEISKIRNSGRHILGIESDLIGEGDLVFNGQQLKNHVVVQTAVYYEEIEHAIKCGNCGNLNVPSAEKCGGCGQVFYEHTGHHV